MTSLNASLEQIIEQKAGSSGEKGFLRDALKSTLDRELKDKSSDIANVLYEIDTDGSRKWAGERADNYAREFVDILSTNYSKIKDYLEPGFFNKYLNPFRFDNVLDAAGLVGYGAGAANYLLGNPGGLIFAGLGGLSMTAADQVRRARFNKTMKEAGWADSTNPSLAVDSSLLVRGAAAYFKGTFGAPLAIYDYLRSKNKEQRKAAQIAVYKSVSEFKGRVGDENRMIDRVDDRVRHLYRVGKDDADVPADPRILPATGMPIHAVNASYDGKHNRPVKYNIGPRATKPAA